MLLSRSEFVIKTGNKQSKITIEKKVQRGGGRIDEKKPRRKQITERNNFTGGGAGQKALSVFLISHSATSSG